jgi:hypothetical protein
MALGLISLIEFGADGGVFASGTGTTPLDEAKDPAVKHALLTALINRLDLNKTKAPEADTRAAFHCAAALGDVERLKALLNSPFLTSVDACDGLSRTALHWACRFSSMMAVDILLANGADPDLRASSKVDAIWAEEELSLWDSRLREPAKNDGTRGDYKKGATGQAIGPCGMDLLREKHHARVFARAVVDLALGRRDEESRDFVGVAARALAAEGRAAKEAQRLHEEGAAEPDKPIEEMVKPGKATDDTHSLPYHRLPQGQIIAHPADFVQSGLVRFRPSYGSNAKLPLTTCLLVMVPSRPLTLNPLTTCLLVMIFSRGGEEEGGGTARGDEATSQETSWPCDEARNHTRDAG